MLFFVSNSILASVFDFQDHNFVLNGQKFVIRSGEMHPPRIPHEYWRHRIQMAKAMGMNTISIYVFWNAHEREEGKYNFSGQNNVSEFLSLVQAEDMYVILRPGPYICSEWDFGGIATYLLRDENLKLRTTLDQNYTDAAARFIKELCMQIGKNFLQNGGNVLLIQSENEYASWPQFDENYLTWVRDQFVLNGYQGKFYTSDPITQVEKKYILEGAAVGLNGGTIKVQDFQKIYDMVNTPVFVAEFYPGWFRQWTDLDYYQEKDTSEQLEEYLRLNASFNMYVIHGGTNFGKHAGAYGEQNDDYFPVLTSYDFGAPISEYGDPSPNYFLYRNLSIKILGEKNVPAVPKPIERIEIPAFEVTKRASLFKQKFIPRGKFETPQWFEKFGQDQGIVLYEANLTKGELSFDYIHDYAHVFLNGKKIKTINRVIKDNRVKLEEDGLVQIYVIGNGHKCYTANMASDRKGIIGDVLLDGVVVKANWTHSSATFENIQFEIADLIDNNMNGSIYTASFNLNKVGDTFIDFTNLSRGFIFVNNVSLGNYMEGNQKRLYLPGVWLKTGKNEIIIVDFDLSETPEVVVSGKKQPFDCPNKYYLQGVTCVPDFDGSDSQNLALIISLSVCIPLAVIIGVVATVFTLRYLKKKRDAVPYGSVPKEI